MITQGTKVRNWFAYATSRHLTIWNISCTHHISNENSWSFLWVCSCIFT